MGVAVLQVRRDRRKCNRTGSAWDRERVGQRYLWDAVDDVVREYGGGGIRSAGKIAGDVAGVVRVVDAPAAAEDSLALVIQLVGEAEAGGEVVLVGLAEGAASTDLVRGLHGEGGGEVGAEEFQCRLVGHDDFAGGE